MPDDPTENPADLKQQERKFVWQLIAFTLLVCVGGLLFVVFLGPKIAKNRESDQIERLNRFNKLLSKDETIQQATQVVEASQTLARCQDAFEKIHDEASSVLAGIDTKKAGGEAFGDLPNKLKELIKQQEANAKRIDDLALEIEKLPPAPREKFQELQRQLRLQTEAALKKYELKLATLEPVGKMP
jgi:septal ring factor EnvC (AmiA/AmiB activator)